MGYILNKFLKCGKFYTGYYYLHIIAVKKCGYVQSDIDPKVIVFIGAKHFCFKCRKVVLQVIAMKICISNS